MSRTRSTAAAAAAATAEVQTEAPAAEVQQWRVLLPLLHDGQIYAAGDTLALPAAVAAPLQALAAIEPA
ncbi:MAG: hypothetical protein AB1735_02110 [Pseudomonadota bacterium]|jgi:hypothetical protein